MRTLTITTNADPMPAMHELARKIDQAGDNAEYMGEFLNFTSPGLFFSRLTERRWNLVSTLIGSGKIGVRELARRLGRDVKRVHEDAAAMVELGLIEKDESGALFCPFEKIHIDMDIHAQKAA